MCPSPTREMLDLCKFGTAAPDPITAIVCKETLVRFAARVNCKRVQKVVVLRALCSAHGDGDGEGDSARACARAQARVRAARTAALSVSES